MLTKLITGAKLALALAGQPDTSAVEPQGIMPNEIRTEASIGLDGYARQRNIIEYDDVKLQADQFNDRYATATVQAAFAPKPLDDLSLYYLREDRGDAVNNAAAIGVGKRFELTDKLSVLLSPGFKLNIGAPNEQWMYAQAKTPHVLAEYVQFGEMQNDDVIHAYRASVDFERFYATAAMNDGEFNAWLVPRGENYVGAFSATVGDGGWYVFSQHGMGNNKEFSGEALDEAAFGFMMPAFFIPYLANFTTWGDYTVRAAARGDEDIDYVEGMAGMKLPGKWGSVGLGATYDDSGLGMKAAYYNGFDLGEHFGGSVDVQASKQGVQAYLRFGYTK